MLYLGYDAGTYNGVCARRDANQDFAYKREINAFIEIPLENRFTFNMMKSAGIPLIERDNVAYALGEAAVNMAYTLPTLELKRPMKDGCVNPQERDAFQIMSVMMHSLIDPVEKETLLYYCVPADAVNKETDADYHQKIVQAIFDNFESDEGYKIISRPINEALALVYAELATKAFTGIGISFGGGMVNVCYAMYGNPIFKFAIVNSGDWIDKQAAKAIGESPTFVNKQKMKVSLVKEPTTLVERAIQTQYNLMIEKAIKGIMDGFANANKTVRSDTPVDIVVAGGTSLIHGFRDVFDKAIRQVELPITIGEVIQPADALYSVARGCLIAAEAAGK
jgi:actin-like ATPase involved in cell morphogenesis